MFVSLLIIENDGILQKNNQREEEGEKKREVSSIQFISLVHSSGAGDDRVTHNPDHTIQPTVYNRVWLDRN